MTDSDVDTVKVMMDDCRLLTDSDSESVDSMDWVFLGANSEDTSSLDCVSEDDFFLLKHTPVDSLGRKESSTAETVMFNCYKIRRRKETTVADIVKEHVLPLLPAKNLCMLRVVCKEWNAWISSPFLAYKQALYFRKFSGLICQSPFDNKSLLISAEPSTCGIPVENLHFIHSEKIIKSTCNGLICYYEESLYYIYNPVTMQQHSLPAPNYFHWPGTVAILAFEPSTFNFNSHYELACAVPTKMDDNDAVYIEFEIFSSRSCSWRVGENICTDSIGSGLIGKGFYSRGVAYWETEGGYLLALDLRTEQYGIIKLPEGSGSHCALAELGGEMCYIMPDKDNCRVGIFGGMKMELKCMIQLQLGYYSLQHLQKFEVLGFVDNGEVLVILLDYRVIAYHTVEMTYHTLKYFPGVQDLNFFPYVNSLVSANSPPLREMMDE